MIGDEARMISIMAGRDHGSVLAHLKLSGEPLAESVFAEADGVRVENVSLVGWYVMYKEDNGTWRKRGKPFIVWSPLYKKKAIRVASWAAFEAQKDEASIFIAKWTNIGETVFTAAEINPLVKIPFGLEIERYIANLGARGCGESTLCYAADCGLAEYIHNNKNKEMEVRINDGTKFW